MDSLRVGSLGCRAVHGGRRESPATNARLTRWTARASCSGRRLHGRERLEVHHIGRAPDMDLVRAPGVVELKVPGKAGSAAAPKTPAARSSNWRRQSVTWLGCMSCLCALSAIVLSSPKASMATVALNAGEWFRRGRLPILCALENTGSILAYRSNYSTRHRAQISGTTSVGMGVAWSLSDLRSAFQLPVLPVTPFTPPAHSVCSKALHSVSRANRSKGRDAKPPAYSTTEWCHGSGVASAATMVAGRGGTTSACCARCFRSGPRPVQPHL